ncbi:uncharacterized protein LOC132294541 [Cornus florida]|uniref:uncharacterized protein LOC132294541 n=1 Tax=Cornus florida TaxID=4283 RepID=UPI0028A29050|nr:uncharacterized protein LOC132294541 [Cornus florida]
MALISIKHMLLLMVIPTAALLSSSNNSSLGAQARGRELILEAEELSYLIRVLAGGALNMARRKIWQMSEDYIAKYYGEEAQKGFKTGKITFQEADELLDLMRNTAAMTCSINFYFYPAYGACLPCQSPLGVEVGLAACDPYCQLVLDSNNNVACQLPCASSPSDTVGYGGYSSGGGVGYGGYSAGGSVGGYIAGGGGYGCGRGNGGCGVVIAVVTILMGLVLGR